jgi:peptidoglycan L-alanyl-D-glutamate endopeptidase CwlK
MRDIISKDRVSVLHPRVRQEVERLIDQIENNFPKTISIRIVQGLRTFAEQNALYNKRPKVTNAKGGQSIHNYGLAIDFAILYDKDNNGTYETLSWDLIKDFDRDGQKDWSEVVSVFEKAGWTWGGRWKSIVDNPHLEKSFGYGWRDLLALRQRNYVDPQGYVTIK